MGDLIGKNINATYQGLLKTTTNGGLVGDVITDGLGQPSALTLGRNSNGSSFDGALNVAGNISSDKNIISNINLTVKNNATIDNNLTVSGSTNLQHIDATTFNFAGAGNFGSAITFGNTISVQGISTFGSTINVTGDITATQDLTIGGTLRATGDLIAFSSSDSRLKDNLKPIDSQNYVSNLTGFEFDWNERSKRSGKGKGIIAQDLYKIDKSLVHETKEGYLSVDYIGLIPVLIEEVKRLSKEIEELKKL